MKLADFSKREREDHAIRLCIYRRIQKFALILKETNLPLPNTVTCIAENGTLSSATESCDTPPQMKVKRVRVTAHGAQTVCQARNEKLSNYKIAFKHATTVYSREKENKGGMLAQDVSDLIKNHFKESISARTIQRNVKNGQVGSSPVRRGPKGRSIPEIRHKNLLMAFKSFVVINQLNGVARETRHKKLALRVHQAQQEAKHGIFSSVCFAISL